MTQPPPSFGAWMSERRRALDLTQAALAERVACAAETLRKIEAGRLRPSRLLAERLAQELGLPAEQRDAFVRLARGAAAPAVRPPPPAPLTPLIGRAALVAQAEAILLGGTGRLLTLTGPPGVGKTHLALHLASGLHRQFADGAAFIPLSALEDPAHVPTVIAEGLGLAHAAGLAPLARLHDYLAGRRLLLVLDNCEHLLLSAPALAELLAHAPGLTVLATSRTPLAIAGEQVLPLSPLELPRLDALPPPDELGRVAAIELFLSRARAHSPAFALTVQNAHAVAAICVALDGLPLAIELAAARARHFALPTLHAHLGQAFDWPASGAGHLPPHQRTLGSTLAWSFRLLGDDERRLFLRLGVFAGGCTLDAVTAVCGERGQAPPLAPLAALIDSSLLVPSPGAEPDALRYTMLQMIREYALVGLAARGERPELARRHAGYYLGQIEAAVEQLRGHDQGRWLARIDREGDNLRAALRWAWEQHDGEILLRLAAALCDYWTRRGHYAEGGVWLERTLALVDPRVLPLALRRRHARVLLSAWSFAFHRGDASVLATLPQEDLAGWREVGDWCGLSYALHTASLRALLRGDGAAALAMQEENVALCRRTCDRWHLALALFCLVMNLHAADAAGSDELYAETVALLNATGDSWLLSYLLGALGDNAVRRGDYATARAWLQQAVTLFLRVGDTLSAEQRLQLLGRLPGAPGEALHGLPPE